MKTIMTVVFTVFASCALALTETVDGVTWQFEVKNQTAKLGSMTIRYSNSGLYESWEGPTLETDTQGDVSIPEMLRGGNWQDPTNSLHHFFRVKVEMP